MSFLKLDNVKPYGASPVVRGVSFGANEGGFRRLHARSVGLRKIDLAADDPGLESPTAGVYSDSRLVTGVAPRTRQVSVVFPVLCALSAHERLRQHSLWAQDGQDAR
jgi:hypothetical protein